VTPPTFTVNSCSYSINGKTIIARADATVTAAGTGTGGMQFSLPFTAAAFKYVGSAIEHISTGTSGGCLIAPFNSTVMSCGPSAGTFIVTGQGVAAEVTYELP
jgi:hypothetical protein